MIVALLACSSEEPGDAQLTLLDPIVLDVDVDGPLRLFAAGDTDIGNAVRDELAQRGPETTFAALDPVLDDVADVRLVNLETVPIDEGIGTAMKDGLWAHRMNPDWLSLLAERELSVATLANNHTMDYAAEGMRVALDNLDEHGIVGFGSGLDHAEAWRPVILDAGHTRVGILGVLQYNSSLAELDFYADDDAPGVASASDYELAARVEALRADVDVVVVTVHWGTNYEPVTDKQQELAEAFAAADVDVVVGHGAHHVQRTDRIDGMPVVFSLGNFVFTSWGGYDGQKLSALSRLTFDGGALETLELYPIFTDNRITDFASRPATRDERVIWFEPTLSGYAWTERDGWYVTEL